jgi:hypothetical protein
MLGSGEWLGLSQRPAAAAVPVSVQVVRGQPQLLVGITDRQVPPESVALAAALGYRTWRRIHTVTPLVASAA